MSKIDPALAGREIELPAGPLGLVFQAGSTKIKEVKRDSAVKAACDAGDRCIAFRPPGGEERVDCRDMTDTEFVKLLTAHKDTPGRVMYVMKPGDSMTDTSSDGRVAPAAGELTRELFAAIRAKNKDRVRELLEMGADVNAYEPADCTTAFILKEILIFAMLILILAFIIMAKLQEPGQYKSTPLHVAVTTGDPDMVALLLEFGADRNAPATFWNCCCCKKTPTQFVDMVTDERSIPVEQREPIKELLIG